MAAYLGALRAGMVVVPVNPRSATGELMRTIADSGARMVIADGGTVSTVREAVGGLNEALESVGMEPAARPRIVTVGTTLAPGERGWDQLVATQGPAVAGARRPRGARRTPLHQRYVGPPSRGDAVATGRCSPTSSRWRRSTRR